MFMILKTDFFIIVSLQQWLKHSYYRKKCGNFPKKTLIFKKRKYPTNWSDKGFKVITVLNQGLPALHRGSLKLTLTELADLILSYVALQAGLMSRDETQNNAPVITRSGFQFLLMERSSQVGDSIISRKFNFFTLLVSYILNYIIVGFIYPKLCNCWFHIS